MHYIQYASLKQNLYTLKLWKTARYQVTFLQSELCVGCYLSSDISSTFITNQTVLTRNGTLKASAKQGANLLWYKSLLYPVSTHITVAI